jgi:hypothetical protein
MERYEIEFDEATFGTFTPASGTSYVQRLIDYGEK